MKAKDISETLIDTIDAAVGHSYWDTLPLKKAAIAHTLAVIAQVITGQDEALDKQSITVANLRQIGYDDFDGRWMIPGDVDMDDNSRANGHNMRPILAFSVEQLKRVEKQKTKKRGKKAFVQAHMFATFDDLDDETGMTFWIMENIGNVLAWHKAFLQPLISQVGLEPVPQQRNSHGK